MTGPHDERCADPVSGATARTPLPRGVTFQGLLTVLLILTLLAAVGLLLTERNQRRYFVRYQAPFVLIDRGFPLPYGHGPYRPTDPQLAKAYAPFKLPASVAAPVEDEPFDDRAGLDQRVGDLLLSAAKARLAATDDGHLNDGLAYLAQADGLVLLSSDQRRSARALRAEVAYVQASDELARALAALREVEDLLKLGADTSNLHTKDSADLLDRLTPAVDAVVRAARNQGVVPSTADDLPAPLDGGVLAPAPATTPDAGGAARPRPKPKSKSNAPDLMNPF